MVFWILFLFFLLLFGELDIFLALVGVVFVGIFMFVYYVELEDKVMTKWTGDEYWRMRDKFPKDEKKKKK